MTELPCPTPSPPFPSHRSCVPALLLPRPTDPALSTLVLPPSPHPHPSPQILLQAVPPPSASPPAPAHALHSTAPIHTPAPHPHPTRAPLLATGLPSLDSYVHSNPSGVREGSTSAGGGWPAWPHGSVNRAPYYESSSLVGVVPYLCNPPTLYAPALNTSSTVALAHLRPPTGLAAIPAGVGHPVHV